MDRMVGDMCMYHCLRCDNLAVFTNEAHMVAFIDDMKTGGFEAQCNTTFTMNSRSFLGEHLDVSLCISISRTLMIEIPCTGSFLKDVRKS